MESYANVSLMIMYDDESVEVRYRNEANVHLSPCGCEFLLVKPSGQSLRQRTRFTTSTYKVGMKGTRKYHLDSPEIHYFICIHKVILS